MGTIFSGTGLISGLNINNIVDSLIAIEARPRDQLVQRTRNLDAQRAAFADLGTQISAIVARLVSLNRASAFQVTTSASSNAAVLSATTSDGAMPGSYSFIVRQLAATHQLISRGFADRAAPIGVGTLTIESSQARVDSPTSLDALNGYAGVQRGQFRITNSAGNEATIDLRDAATLQDVVARVNAAGINIQAAVHGDHLVFTDRAGGNGQLRLSEIDGGRTAADLGFAAGNTSDGDGDGSLTGGGLVSINANTPLSALNDGLGVRIARAATDFHIQTDDGHDVSVDLSDVLKPETRLGRLNHGRGVDLGRVRVTLRGGETTEVDLSSATTVADVKSALEAAFGGGRLTVTLNGGRLLVADSRSDGAGEFKLEDVSGNTARDLGLSTPSRTNTIAGTNILFAATIGDMLAAINQAAGNLDQSSDPPVQLIRAEIAPDGRSLQIVDARDAGRAITLTGGGDSTHALEDLGFSATGEGGASGPAGGRRLISDPNTVLLRTLNGGHGANAGTIELHSGTDTVQIDLHSAQTLADVIEAINSAASSAGLAVQAGYDRTGTRLVLSRTDGGSDPLSVTDVDGDFARTFGLSAAATTLRSANLQRRYVSENTKLANLNGGQGVAAGQLKLTNSLGISSVVDLRSATSLADVISTIAAANIGISARINDTGDGLLLTDTAGGTQTMKVEEQGSTTARDLNLLGTVSGNALDGSFEERVTIGPGDTLDTLAQRIGAGTRLATASVFSDGTTVAPYRLRLAAARSGAAGALLVDSDLPGLDFSTLSQAQDARVLLGDSGGGVYITSSTNTISGAIDGVTLQLGGVSNDPVTINVQRDLGGITQSISGLVSDFNAAASKISSLTSYDSQTEQAAILLGDSTISTVQARLFRAFTGAIDGANGTIRRLSQLGITLGDNSQLSFDQDKFRAALEANPEEVARFFTNPDTGAAKKISDELKKISDTNGLIDRRKHVLDDQKDLLTQRIDALNTLLDQRRDRLMRQYQAMEQSLSQLQAQQSALSSFTGATATR